MIRKIILALSCAGVLVPALAFAMSGTSTNNTEGSLVSQLNSTLHVGDRGNQVKVLQALLATDSSIFPQASITGNFGPQTQQAVKRFQRKNGLDAIGQVGPKTLAKLNEQLQETPLMFEAAPASSEMTNSSSAFGGTTATMPTELCIPAELGDAAQQFIKEDGSPIIPPCSTTDWTLGHGVASSSFNATNIDDLSMDCKNPWDTEPATIKWPKEIPCPVATPTGSGLGGNTSMSGDTTSTLPSGSASSWNENDFVMQCANPWGTQPTTIMWPKTIPCPTQQSVGQVQWSGNTSELMVDCKNPWSSNPATVKWPKGELCPADILAKIPSYTGMGSTTMSGGGIPSTNISDFTDQCKNPVVGATPAMVPWPKGVPCPPALSMPTLSSTTIPSKQCPNPWNPSASSNISWPAGVPCLTPIQNTPGVDLSAWHISSSTFNTMGGVNMSQMNGNVGSGSSVGNSTGTIQCAVTIGGNIISVPWPQGVTCNGHIPGM